MTIKNKGLEKTLEHLRSVAVDTNAEWADRLGIPVAAAITCVKPSGPRSVSWWIVPVAYMLATVPIISVLSVVTLKIP